ncbi:hypothetical protein H6F50_26205 [Coleofasciculus sp. FACHB-712]|uniref:hypothetical protein n=1 Tax=Coleofasciculus sp. FACHB-712 TaxID=2692789 RepID=UPI001681F0F8|nr:hypothetical protein [Coleofasciculus sp. FACHB-712]MBD1945803.1 hypothetical protein [Coleofasciculus sp. FACHB-712]
MMTALNVVPVTNEIKPSPIGTPFGEKAAIAPVNFLRGDYCYLRVISQAPDCISSSINPSLGNLFNPSLFVTNRISLSAL